MGRGASASVPHTARSYARSAVPPSIAATAIAAAAAAANKENATIPHFAAVGRDPAAGLLKQPASGGDGPATTARHPQVSALSSHPRYRAAAASGSTAPRHTAGRTAPGKNSVASNNTSDSSSGPSLAGQNRPGGGSREVTNRAASPQPQQVQPGTPAADWERAMDAKLAQWRFMNLVAVAELQAEERAACSGLIALTDELEAAMDDVAALTVQLDAVRGAQAGRTFAERAAPPLASLSTGLEALAPEHRRACEGLVRSLEELRLRNIIADAQSSAALAREIARFRVAAVRFSTAAQKRGASEQCAVALEDLARVVADEAPGVRKVLCRSVKDAVDAVDSNMAHRAGDVSRRRKSKRSSSSTSSSNSGGGKSRPRRTLSAPTSPSSSFSSLSAVAGFVPKFAVGQAS